MNFLKQYSSFGPFSASHIPSALLYSSTNSFLIFLLSVRLLVDVANAENNELSLIFTISSIASHPLPPIECQNVISVFPLSLLSDPADAALPHPESKVMPKHAVSITDKIFLFKSPSPKIHIFSIYCAQ